MKKELKYTIIDMRSFCHAYQFENSEKKLYLFLEMIRDNTANSDKNLFIFTDNDSLFRKDKYKELGIDYKIKQINDIEIIKDKISSYIEENKFNWKIVNSSGYETKDIIYSSIYNMHEFVYNKKDKYTLKINLLTTNKNLLISKFLFPDSEFFELKFNRYVRSKEFSGFEVIENINKYISNQYELNLTKQINNIKNKDDKELFIYYQNLINDISVLTGIKNSDKPIKIVNGIGLKRAAKFINNYISLKHFNEIYELDTNDNDIKLFKKNISKNDLKTMIKLSKINKVKFDIDKEYIFSILL